ncbi:cytochrome c oxidase subunit 3 [Halovulum marinum]|nr:cytochrome c oxidase subunit 3 [Halovulum marinum]
MIVFLLVLATIIGLWLSRQRLASKPWLETGAPPARAEAVAVAPARLGLAVFLAVVGGLFAMLGSAFVMQIDEYPWQLVPLPRMIWFSTAALVAASLALHRAAGAARRAEPGRRDAALAAATLATLAFLAGQGLVWRALGDGGVVLSGTPAGSLVYLITGLHGLHVLGGLVALGRVWLRQAQRPGSAQARAAIALCAIYWHALLFVWLALIALFSGLANEVLALFGALLT